ncbi:MAG: MBOAT family protein [Bacteroidales bacterium]|nr:MBOAT family protein [Bacteroidales bacterium]
MLFNSFEFLVFFVTVAILYFIIKDKWRWILLLGASYLFYGSWSVAYMGLIVISTIITFSSGVLLEKQNNNPDLSEKIRKRNKRLIVLVSLCTNLGILLFFKYYNFFASTVNSIIPDSLPIFEKLLPVVGISFYTFQALSYTMDVYRGRMEAQKHFGKYALFVSFFPQLVAGPIERASNLLPQFNDPKKFNYQDVRSGCLLIIWGLFKKVVVSDRLGVFVNEVYSKPETSTGIVAIVAALFFAIQIYLDFSAYSEIAIGAARIFGYKLTINFKRPYLSTSFNDFWKRWHISLNTWFLEYLYIPIGGSRGKYISTIRNVLIVFLISGLWHGASWNFVIWGAINSMYLLIFDRIFFNNKKKDPPLKNKMFRGTLIMLFWAASLVFFRAKTFSDAIIIYKKFSFSGLDQLYNFGLNERTFKFAVSMFILVYIIELFQETGFSVERLFKAPLLIRWALYIALPLSIIYFGAYGSSMMDSSFIYFQF